MSSSTEVVSVVTYLVNITMAFWEFHYVNLSRSSKRPYNFSQAKQHRCGLLIHGCWLQAQTFFSTKIISYKILYTFHWNLYSFPTDFPWSSTHVPKIFEDEWWRTMFSCSFINHFSTLLGYPKFLGGWKMWVMIALPPGICLYRINQTSKCTTATGEDLAWIWSNSRGLFGKLFVSSPCRLWASKF